MARPLIDYICLQVAYKSYFGVLQYHIYCITYVSVEGDDFREKSIIVNFRVRENGDFIL